MKKFLILALSVMAAGLLLSACGGGDNDASSSPTAQQDILTGDFRAVHFIPSGDAPTVVDATFNGDGTGSGAPVTAPAVGALGPTPAADAESFTYAVTADGSITSFDTSRFGSDLVGQTNADGTLITLYDNVAGIDGLTQVGAAVRKGTGMGKRR